MANRSNEIGTHSDCLQSSSKGNEINNCSINMEEDENDVMMQGGDDGNDNNSIPTTMGVRASCMEYSNRNRSACHLRNQADTYASNDNISVAENIGSFFIPLPIPTGRTAAPSESTNERQGVQQQQQQQMNLDDNDCDDDISVLTEYSMEETEDDNLSQTTANTAWTGVTEVTGSTAAGAPQRQNFGSFEARKLSRQRRLASKRTRVQQSKEASSSLSIQEHRITAENDQLKRRRKI